MPKSKKGLSRTKKKKKTIKESFQSNYMNYVQPSKRINYIIPNLMINKINVLPFFRPVKSISQKYIPPFYILLGILLLYLDKSRSWYEIRYYINEYINLKHNIYINMYIYIYIYIYIYKVYCSGFAEKGKKKKSSIV